MNQTLTEKLFNATNAVYDVIATYGDDVGFTMACPKECFIKRYAERLITSDVNARTTANTLVKIQFTKVITIEDEQYIATTEHADAFINEWYNENAFEYDTDANTTDEIHNDMQSEQDTARADIQVSTWHLSQEK